jgi:hypothetical protein
MLRISFKCITFGYPDEATPPFESIDEKIYYFLRDNFNNLYIIRDILNNKPLYSHFVKYRIFLLDVKIILKLLIAGNIRLF